MCLAGPHHLQQLNLKQEGLVRRGLQTNLSWMVTYELNYWQTNYHHPRLRHIKNKGV